MAIASVLNARKTAQVTKVIGLMKTMVTSNEQYHLRFRSFAGSETDIINSSLIVDFVSSPSPSYTFRYSGSVATWSMNANPTTPGVTGDSYFFVDQTGVIRFSRTRPATSADSPVD